MTHNARGLKSLPADGVRQLIIDRSKFNPASGCWDWLGARNENGYARCRRAGEAMVSRLAWRAWRELQPFPDGLEADHTCRNRACVNPAHIEAVTVQVNRQRRSDAMRAAGRFGKPMPHGRPGSYTRGCRCDACRACWTAYMKARRARP